MKDGIREMATGIRSKYLSETNFWRSISGIFSIVFLTCSSHGADVWSNSIQGTNPNTDDPYTAGDIADPNLTVSGIGRGAGILGTNANNRYNANTWIVSTDPGAPVTTEQDAINGDKYFTFSLTPATGFEIDFTSLVLTVQRSSTGPQTFGLYSSATGFGVGDGLVAPIAVTPISTPVTQTISLTSSALQNVLGPIEFRIYAWSATASTSGSPPNPGSGTFSINDFTFNGLVLQSVGSELFWDGGGNWSPTGPGAGGAGTWSGGGSWTDSSKANFGGTASSVTVSNANADGGIHFHTDGYVLSGGAISLGNASVESDPGVVATIETVLTGSAGLNKLGAGTLVLTGTNTFTGDVGIYSGTLAVGADENLGTEENDLIFSGGTLKVSSSLELAAGRSVTGSGALSVDSGSTLTFLGAVEGSSFAFLDLGVAVFSGDVNRFTGLTFDAAGSIDVSNGAELSGALTTNHTVGTAGISGALDLTANTAQAFTVFDGSSEIDLDISANISSANFARIHKLGGGTLRLSGNNSSFVAGMRIGTIDTSDGGRVILANNNSLGSGVLQFNWGVLEAETSVDFTNGISLGALDGKSAVFQGGNMSFSGSVSFFETSGRNNHLTVNNTTTFSGPMTYSGSFGGTGIVLAGTGTLRSTGNGTGVEQKTTVTETATLVIDGSWGGAVTIEAAATLQGVGTIGGLVNIAGTHAVGNSAGIQTIGGGISYLSGSKFEWDLKNNANAAAGTDFDQLVISGGAITIESGVTMELIFNAQGSTVDWADSFWDTDHSWTIVDNIGEGILTGQFALNPASQWFDANGLLLSALDSDAAFVLSSVNGDIILTYYAVPIPEPSALALLGFTGFLLARRRRA